MVDFLCATRRARRLFPASCLAATLAAIVANAPLTAGAQAQPAATGHSDEPVSPLHQIQHALGLPDPALPREKKTDPEDVRQRSVERHRRRELHLQHRFDATVELRRFQLCANDWNARGARCLLEADR